MHGTFAPSLLIASLRDMGASTPDPWGRISTSLHAPPPRELIAASGKRLAGPSIKRSTDIGDYGVQEVRYDRPRAWVAGSIRLCDATIRDV